MSKILILRTMICTSVVWAINLLQLLVEDGLYIKSQHKYLLNNWPEPGSMRHKYLKEIVDELFLSHDQDGFGFREDFPLEYLEFEVLPRF